MEISFLRKAGRWFMGLVLLYYPPVMLFSAFTKPVWLVCHIPVYMFSAGIVCQFWQDEAPIMRLEKEVAAIKRTAVEEIAKKYNRKPSEYFDYIFEASIKRLIEEIKSSSQGQAD